MPLCTKCNIEKPVTEFYTEVRKDNGRTYTKKYCNECFRKQARDWKLKNRIAKSEIKAILNIQFEKLIEYPQEEISPEITPKESQPVLIRCNSCGMEKMEIEYYAKNKSRCRSCLLKIRQESKVRENGGTQWKVLSQPGKYQSEEQFNELYRLMTAIGWQFTDGVFWKEGFKDKDKNFFFKTTAPTAKKKNRNRIYGPSKLTGKSKLDKYKDEIIKHRNNGVKFEEIAELYNCSHTLVRTFYNDKCIYGYADK